MTFGTDAQSCLRPEECISDPQHCTVPGADYTPHKPDEAYPARRNLLTGQEIAAGTAYPPQPANGVAGLELEDSCDDGGDHMTHTHTHSHFGNATAV